MAQRPRKRPCALAGSNTMNIFDPHSADDRIQRYVSLVNLIPNLELLTDSENLEKNAKPFDAWIETHPTN